jgi:hypothetical protein
MAGKRPADEGKVKKHIPNEKRTIDPFESMVLLLWPVRPAARVSKCLKA